MSMITDLIERLRTEADGYKGYRSKRAVRVKHLLQEAADTIKVQSAKIHAYAMERSTAYYIVNSAYFPEDKIHQLDLVLKGEIPKEYDILAYKKAFEDIRAEIRSNAFYENPRIQRVIRESDVLKIIDKHDPSKAEPVGNADK